MVLKTIGSLIGLLSAAEKRQFYLCIFGTVIVALLDALGVLSVAPFVALASNPELINANAVLRRLYATAASHGVSGFHDFIILTGVSSILFLAIAQIVKALVFYAQTRFSIGRQFGMGKRLIEGYLDQRYEWFLHRNSSDLAKNILSELDEVIYYGFVPLMNLIAYGVSVVTLLCLLVFVNPTVAITSAVFFAAVYCLIFVIVKPSLTKIGIRRTEKNQDRFLAVGEAFGGVKELKINGLERQYLERFSQPARAYAGYQISGIVTAQVPKFIVEILAFGGIISLVMFFVTEEAALTQSLPAITIFAFAGVRLLPACQNVYAAITSLRYIAVGVVAFAEELAALSAPNEDEEGKKVERVADPKVGFKMENVSFSYIGASKPALESVSIEFPVGSKTGLVGPSGSGKTTAVDLILGLLEPSSGSLRVDGRDITSANVRDWQSKISYVPQQIFLTDKSVAENIALGVPRNRIEMKRVIDAAKIACIDDVIIRRFPDGYDTVVGERGLRLSGGERQRLGIARALYGNKSILILDEATSALDGDTEAEVVRRLRRERPKLTIIMVAHRLNTLENCDVIYLIKGGRNLGAREFHEINPASETAIF